MLHERYHRLSRILHTRRNDLTVLVERVEKAHNLAAIARTADSVGCDHLHAITQHQRLTLRARAAMGTGKGVKVHIHDSCDKAIERIRKRGMKLVAANFSERAVDYRQIDFTTPCCLVLGEEKFGLSADLAAACDEEVIIPMVGLAGSLNVSVAAALLLYEARRQREAAGMMERGTWDDARIRKTLFEWCHPEIAGYLKARDLPYPALDGNGEIADPDFER